MEKIFSKKIAIVFTIILIANIALLAFGVVDIKFFWIVLGIIGGYTLIEKYTKS